MKFAEGLWIIIAEIEWSEALFAYNNDENPVTGDRWYIEEVSKFVHRKIVSMLRVVSQRLETFAKEGRENRNERFICFFCRS